MTDDEVARLPDLAPLVRHLPEERRHDEARHGRRDADAASTGWESFASGLSSLMTDLSDPAGERDGERHETDEKDDGRGDDSPAEEHRAEGKGRGPHGGPRDRVGLGAVPAWA